MTVPVGISRTISSLSVRNYRLYWFGQLVSLSGTWMQTIGQAWLVLQLTNSPLALGTVTMLQFLPVTLFTLFGGALADQLPKRKVLFVTQTVSALQALILAFLVYSGLIQLWELYILALTLGLMNAFDNPTRQAFVAEMVGRDRLPNAVALNSALFNSARILGPAIGGIAINVVGLGGTFLLNSLSYLGMIGALVLIHADELHATERSKKGRVLQQVAEGLRYARSSADVLMIVIVLGFIGVFGYNFTVMLPLIAKYVLHRDAAALGALTSAMGVGSLIAAVGVAYANRANRLTLFGGASVFTLMLFLIGLSRLYFLTFVLLVVLGASSVVFSFSANTRLQLIVPNELRGRMMSLYFLLMAGSTPIGGIIVGSLASRIGVQQTVVSVAVMCVVGILLALLYTRRSDRARLAAAPHPSAAD